MKNLPGDLKIAGRTLLGCSCASFGLSLAAVGMYFCAVGALGALLDALGTLLGTLWGASRNPAWGTAVIFI